ncbi:MAG: WD40/YVTN/BNR-like repeat-containing protein, partial [Marinirhabdus sp.]
WRGPAYVWRAQGIRNSYWQEISFGDGFDVVPDRDDSRYGWSMSQQGFVSRYDWVTGNNYLVRPTHPDPEVFLRFNWNSAINIDPFNNSTIYFGSQFVHKSTDKGLTWQVISPDLTTNDPEKQKQSESGGLTMDATGAENHTTILVIEPSPLEKDMLWVGTDDGRVHYTQNGGKSWNDVSRNLKKLPEGSWIVQIKASNKNKGEALLVANDYRRFNYAPYAYRTTNYGKTWERIVAENDAESYALSIVEDPEEKNLIFLGTDDGLYISTNAGGNWLKYTNGFPTAPVKDLVVHPRENDLVIGTFGRAAWVLDDIRPLRAIAKAPSILYEKLKVFNPPTAYRTAYQQPSGSRFGGDAIYNGENRGRGAVISYYFKAAEKTTAEPGDKKPMKDKDSDDEREGEKETKGPGKDSIYMKIYDGTRLIRTLKRKIPDSTGIYKWTWFLDEAGTGRPSRTLRKRKREPGGTGAKPGTYRVVMEHDGKQTETQLKVESDPRLHIPQKAIDDRYSASK